MRKTLTINLGGTVYTINEDAYELLESYLEALRTHFNNSEEGEEIVNDMELRISEIFSEHLARGVQVIDYIHVEQVIVRMGKPEEMEEKEETTHATAQNDTTQEVKRRLFRNADDKILGGVISGLAAYLGWDVTLLRLAVILFTFFVHGFLLAYVIAWIIIPIAATAADKLAMYGKAPNLENIGKTVTEGFEKIKDNVVRNPQSRTFWREFGEVLVKIIGFLIKFVLAILVVCCAPFLILFLLLCILFLFISGGLLAAVPTVLLELTNIFPELNLNLQLPVTHPIASVLFAISGILLVTIPLIGIIQFCMSHFGKWQPMSLSTKTILIVLWTCSLIFTIGATLWFLSVNASAIQILI